MSVSSEITRIQNAKASLKTSINSKTDSQHQITTETIDDYADFVDSIQTGGGQPNLQEKTITITEDGTTIVEPDSGYDGLSKVTVITNYSPPTPIFPTTHQEVEYIQSTGTQYIDTGVKASSQLKIEITGITTTYAEAGVLYSGGDNWGDKYIQGEYDSASYFTFGTQNYHFSPSFTIGNPFTITQDKNLVYTGTILRKTFNQETFESNYSIYLFAYNRGGSVGEYGYYKLKSCKIYDNDVLVRDFIPCYRKSDGVIGLYDIIGETFYINAGTGTFLKGNNV